MIRIAFPVVMLGLFLFSNIGSIFASDIDELRDRAKALRAKAAVLAEQGNKEHARRIEMEAEELLEIAERLEASTTGKLGKDVGPNIERSTQGSSARFAPQRAKHARGQCRWIRHATSA